MSKMPPMEREKHESLLEELLNPELEHSRRTEILQELRADYNSVHSDFTELIQTKEKLEKDNADLVVSNSKLFRQAGITGSDEQEEANEKEFSETITLSDLERTANV